MENLYKSSLKRKMMSVHSVESASENEDIQARTSGLKCGRFSANLTGYSPMSELSLNLAELSPCSNNSLHDTPKRRLSLCSASSTPGVLSISNVKQCTPDSQGIRFRGLNLSSDEESPFMLYNRSENLQARDSNSQLENESSPTEVVFARQINCRASLWSVPSTLNPCQETSATHGEPEQSFGEAGARSDDKPSTLRQIPGFSPIPSSPVEATFAAAASPLLNLHFEKGRVHSKLVRPSQKIFLQHQSDVWVKDLDNFLAPAGSHGFTSSTPLHSHNKGTATQELETRSNHLNFDISSSFSQVDGSNPNSSEEQLTPEIRFPTRDLESNSENERIREYTKRNLFHANDSTDSPSTKPADSAAASVALRSICANSKDSISTGKVSALPPSALSGYTLSSGSVSSGNACKDSSLASPSSSVSEMSHSSSEDLNKAEIKMNVDDNEDVDLGDEDWAEEHAVWPPLDCSGEQQSLIGDFTLPYALPLVKSKHPDLKAISPDTMARIMSGEFDAVISSLRVIDCRYPYEFKGGHIKGAKNIDNQEDLLAELFPDNKSEQSVSSDMRSILIFHCEFSSERAPKMVRFLRNKDRDLNRARYPSLLYPELYILEGGYKAFFEKYPELCEPNCYVPMLHWDHADDLKKFRAKSRSYEDEQCKLLMKKRHSSMKH